MKNIIYQVGKSLIIGLFLTLLCNQLATAQNQEAEPEPDDVVSPEEIVTSPEQSNASVTGTVTYRERIALPSNAVVQVQLQDVSLQDAPAVTLSEQTFTTNGKQVPFAFELVYDPAAIVPNRTYAIRARISVNGKLRFINTSAYFVITRGNPTEVEVILQRVGDSK
ncbi:YbaY family lipoprotein [Iningainema tapete]|uniref:YbaY family lipoprotein n=1 Tax=Iningainema tapete BLCC-T55 TaxID=2748662 RepID=A0A8J6XNA2_9CYAN|nr:YbaY family lipoprotein [Iningainema tapete]MBD2776126.1 YbaY family lipoprotein [Iningainema tapete BLCC-T55]